MVVEVEHIKIQQVLVNLIQNALQAMQNTPNACRMLTIRSMVRSDEARVEITDSGSGFDMDDLESLFAPFLTTKRDGLGIGLTICRSIVEHHGGTIWAENPPEQGARVVFAIPLAESLAGLSHEPTECVCR
jgi:C4-dicarboxylate-specific signal transduction histidine kinase